MNQHVVYTATARFDGTARALTEDELFRLAPSIFAVTAHDSRSERFKPIPTIEVLRALAKEGFVPVGARQSGTRDETKREFTKHLVRLRRIGDNAPVPVGDTVHEILLRNANDGTSPYDLLSGLFRVRCQNSLVALSETLDTVKVRHTGNVTEKVIEGTYKVLETSERALEAPANWSRMTLDAGERMALAEAAHTLRFEDDAVRPGALLAARRPGDTGSDLWTTFNVVQENCIRGGLTGERRDAEGRPRRVTTRAINGIDQDVRLNKALWLLGERMAQLKAA